jgi:hypothetical protein
MNMNLSIEQLQWAEAQRLSTAGGFANERPVGEALEDWQDADFSFASRYTASTPSVAYDAVDMRLMDTFPASDAVARF